MVREKEPYMKIICITCPKIIKKIVYFFTGKE